MLEAHCQATDVFEDTQARLHGRPSSRGRAGGVPAATCYMGDMGDPTGSRAPRSTARGHPSRKEMQTIRWQLVHSDSTKVPGYPTERQSEQDCRQDCRRSLGAQGPETGGRVGVSFVNPPVRRKKAAATHGSSSRKPPPRSSEGADEVSSSQPEAGSCGRAEGGSSLGWGLDGICRGKEARVSSRASTASEPAWSPTTYTVL